MPRRGLKTKNDRALLLARRDGAGCTFVQGHAVVHFGLGHVHDVDGTVGFKWVDDLSIHTTSTVRQCKTSVPGRNQWGGEVERGGKRWKENSKGTAKKQWQQQTTRVSDTRGTSVVPLDSVTHDTN